MKIKFGNLTVKIRKQHKKFGIDIYEGSTIVYCGDKETHDQIAGLLEAYIKLIA